MKGTAHKPPRRPGMTLVELAEYILGECINVPSGCMIWPWAASTRKEDYGDVGFEGRVWSCHRLVWTALRGSIPAGAEVLHSCDVPRCCRIEHLRIGTQRENVADMIARGRSRSTGLAGSAHLCARLTPENVMEIRSRYAAGGIMQKDLAAEFGVPASHISNIISHRKWKVVP